MAALHIFEKAPTVEALRFELVEQDPPPLAPGQCLIEVRSAAVNMSDAKAALGQMPHAVWPRTPGRDYAGVVVDGPSALVGCEVWGCGGELGITRDGSHAKYLVVDESAVRAKPASIGLREAGAIGVPFVTAVEGLRRAGGLVGKASILVCGANGGVGQAAVQLAAAAGLTVLAAQRSATPYDGPNAGRVQVLDAGNGSLSRQVRDRTGGRGVDLVFNTVGSPYFTEANAAMAKNATHIFIATIERSVPFDILPFFRGQHTYVGIDSLALRAADCATILGDLAPQFEAGLLRPFPIKPGAAYELSDATSAYAAVYSGARHRVVLTP
ncbi:MAG: zinc-binding alcohol dehydrogenase family protein [Rhizobiales bacterium]|nr:zinc-binding alcohol dehydrogenase family protein [Rhizobacter sp.]